MKRLLAAAALLLFASVAVAQSTSRYVVVVRPARDHAAMLRDASVGGKVGVVGRDFRDFVHVDAFAVDLTETEAATLRQRSDVRIVEKDRPIYALERTRSTASFDPALLTRNPNVQTMPPGIAQVHAPDVWTVAKGETINVAAIDTGIDYTHPDLKANYAGGYNAFTGSNDPMDDDGHGTHVAGTLAAADNGIGVVGVAPAARIWSARVLKATTGGLATGSESTAIAGVNWVVGKKKDLGGDWVANMSFGFCADPTDTDCATTPPAGLALACQKAADAGVLLFAASGNDSSTGSAKPVSWPAAYTSVVAVGAVDSTETIADFSNQGPELRLTAPGVNVLSTYIVGKGANAYVTSGSTVSDAAAVQGSKVGTISGPFVYCGFAGSVGECPASVAGKIALIQRGNGVTFNAKTKNALAAGAAGVVIYNCSKTASPSTCTNDSDFTSWTLIGKLADGTTDDPADLAFNWPIALGVSNATGEALRAAAAGTSISLANVTDDYETLGGTSMATPHAAGVAALVWSVAPSASPADVLNALFQSTQDLGAPGRDPVYGYGFVDALAAAKILAPQKFGITLPSGPPGRRILRRG